LIADFINQVVSDPWVLLQIIMLDIVLSGDNAVIIGALTASLPAHQRNKALIFGTLAAVIMRVVLSALAIYVLKIPGILVIGALLLAYIGVKLTRDLLDNHKADGSTEKVAVTGTFASAIWAIAVADFSMSLDNVVAVAGAAHNVPVMVFGLMLSIVLMAVAAKGVSKLIERYSWIAWIGVVLIFYIAGKMLYEGVPIAITQFNHLFG
jgi:YjbE family integral membrane protein